MVTPEKPEVARSERSSWFFRCNHTSALILRTWQTAIFTSKAPALVVLPRMGTPARLLPRDVRDELRSKFGCHRPNIERMVRPIRFGGSIERMVYDEFWGCGRADCGLSYSPATRCGFRGRGPHSNRYRAGKGRRKAAAGEGAISRHAGVGAQRTQRNSGRSRARASLCKWTFLCTRRSS